MKYNTTTKTPEEQELIIKRLKKEKEQAIEEKEEIENELVNKLDLLDAKDKEKQRIEEELKERLKEKEILIKELEEENKLLELGRAANLSAVRLAEKWEKGKREKAEKELGQKVGELENAGNGILAQLYEEGKKSESQKKYIEELEKKFYEQGELLRKELEKTTSQKAEIDILQEQVDLTNELYLNKIPLPKLPRKFKILKEKTKTKFQHLIEKTKHKSQELIARIEVRVK